MCKPDPAVVEIDSNSVAKVDAMQSTYGQRREMLLDRSSFISRNTMLIDEDSIILPVLALSSPERRIEPEVMLSTNFALLIAR